MSTSLEHLVHGALGLAEFVAGVFNESKHDGFLDAPGFVPGWGHSDEEFGSCKPNGSTHAFEELYQSLARVYDLRKVIRVVELDGLITIRSLRNVDGRLRGFDSTGDETKVVTCGCTPDPCK